LFLSTQLLETTMNYLYRSLVSASLTFALVCGLTGCGGGGGAPSSVLKGKVTYNGKPVVVGTLTAYRGSSKTAETMINPDGSYEFVNLSSGDYQLTVTNTDTRTPYGKPVKLPAKYADPSQSGLTATVKRGETTQELQLSKS
jgi:hypothetical protein